MSDKGMIFSAPMVRALLEARKTQTRRILKPAPPVWVYPSDAPGYSCLTPKGHIEFRGRYIDTDGVDHGPASKFIKLPFLKGDRLWVRETWAVASIYDGKTASEINPDRIPLYCGIRYAANQERLGIKDRSARFMPRWASRLWLEITDVRVQRLQAISDADAEAEGCVWDSADGYDVWYVPGGHLPRHGATATECYSILWDSLRTEPTQRWAADPWIVAATFKVHRENIDLPVPRCPHGEPMEGGWCDICASEAMEADDVLL